MSELRPEVQGSPAMAANAVVSIPQDQLSIGNIRGLHFSTPGANNTPSGTGFSKLFAKTGGQPIYNNVTMPMLRAFIEANDPDNVAPGAENFWSLLFDYDGRGNRAAGIGVRESDELSFELQGSATMSAGTLTAAPEVEPDLLIEGKVVNPFSMRPRLLAISTGVAIASNGFPFPLSYPGSVVTGVGIPVGATEVSFVRMLLGPGGREQLFNNTIESLKAYASSYYPLATLAAGYLWLRVPATSYGLTGEKGSKLELNCGAGGIPPILVHLLDPI